MICGLSSLPIEIQEAAFGESQLQKDADFVGDSKTPWGQENMAYIVLSLWQRLGELRYGMNTEGRCSHQRWDTSTTPLRKADNLGKAGLVTFISG